MEKAIPLLFYGWAVGLIPKSIVSIILPLFIIASFIVHRNSKGELSSFILILILSFSVFTSTYAITENGQCIPFSSPSYLSGKVISNPKRRGSSSLGYTLEVEAMGDGKGNWTEAKGMLFVISLVGDEDFGDSVLLSGTGMDGYFLARGTMVRERSPWGRGRRRILSLFLRSLSSDGRSRVASLLFSGSTLDGNTELQDQMKSLGLSHLFALSGMHLGFISLFLGGILRKMLGEKEGKMVLFIILFLFVYINGFTSSLTRALLFLILSSFFGTSWGFSLSFPLLLMLFPSCSRDYGAMLGFVSLSGILMVGEVKEKNALLPFIVSASALATSVPFSLKLFSLWTPIAILLSIPGTIMVEILFFLVVIQIFIPRLDVIINLIYEKIVSLPIESFRLEQRDLSLYWPILAIVILYILLGSYLSFFKRWIIIRACGISTTTALKKSKGSSPKRALP